mmetsp:Transcript_63127/g.204875  ORF Transcript_63127/g.204875 Transcript_63127/m.204875 type:complete len:356 (-) Transcript_63127:112-1179(-)
MLKMPQLSALTPTVADMRPQCFCNGAGVAERRVPPLGRRMPSFRGSMSLRMVLSTLFVAFSLCKVVCPLLAFSGGGYAKIGWLPSGSMASGPIHGRLPERTRLAALSEADLSKIDKTPDELFYLLPRVGVHHVDDNFRRQLTQLFRLLLRPNGDILDLCSQHDSHLPPEVQYNSVTVHGMNYLELLANPRATERFTRNFNTDPTLSNLGDASMDAVVMTVSIQYMQRPAELLREVRRVLRPGGIVILSFSNRMFFNKAVEAWRSQTGMRGLVNLVQGYLQDAGFEEVRAANRVQLPEAEAQWGSFLGGMMSGDGDPYSSVIGFRGAEDAEAKAPLDLDSLEGVSWLPSAGSRSIW